MILADVFFFILRIAELAFAGIVAGINGDYLRSVHNADSWYQGRFIYTEVVAGISLFFALVWLFPFAAFLHWPIDLLISICWFVAFGLLVNFLGGSCGYVFNWDNLSFHRDNQCGKWKAVIAFSFLSAICWFVSAIIGIFWVRDREAQVYRRRFRANPRV
ncbi:membrane-associating domain-containing protein [Durotheca rogersii]|uniref:membrane-associating domain-containing protein n=1 Tax=Durotheca rogersii TaxID=419775 RepID=UPI002220E70F|nr:membrane-associating domain-containing protein [Durotheca rogersii]KAI5860107.1 membrane-associating domain-containing protein [Durotheca rogersii]